MDLKLTCILSLPFFFFREGLQLRISRESYQELLRLRSMLAVQLLSLARLSVQAFLPESLEVRELKGGTEEREELLFSLPFLCIYSFICYMIL